MKCLITDAVYPGIAQELKKYIEVDTTDGRPLSKAELLAEVMRLRGIVPADAVMVGDTRGDVVAGSAAGMYTIGCTWGYGTRAELEGANEIYDAERFA